MSSNAPIRSRWALLAKIAWPTTLLLIAAGLTVFCIRGTNVYSETWEHGWPYVFLRRYCEEPSSWYRFSDGPERSFHPFELFLDILVVVGILAALIFGPRWPSRHAPQRRWNTSLSTFLRIIFGGLAAVVCFGGTRVYWVGSLFGLGETWEHGWPCIFLRRGNDGESTRFMFWESIGEFRPWMLVLDVLVFVVLLSLLYFVPRWLNRRPAAEGRVVFSLSSLFVVLTLACVLLGNIAYALSSSRTERATMANLKKQGHLVEIKYIGPRWLARLIGETDPYRESVFHGCKSITMRGWPGETELQELAAAIQSLPNLEELNCGQNSITDVELQMLLPANRSVNIKKIDFRQTKITGRAFHDLQLWPQLISVNANLAPLDDVGFANLARLPSLRVIDVSETKITKESIAVAAKMLKLEYFTAKRLGFTAADCAVLEARGVNCYVAD